MLAQSGSGSKSCHFKRGLQWMNEQIGGATKHENGHCHHCQYYLTERQRRTAGLWGRRVDHINLFQHLQIVEKRHSAHREGENNQPEQTEVTGAQRRGKDVKLSEKAC